MKPVWLCAALLASADALDLIAKFSSGGTLYPGYQAAFAFNASAFPYPALLEAAGAVSIVGAPGGIALIGTLRGLEQSSTGAIHVHAGPNCADAQGHYIPPGVVDDPWATATFGTTASGDVRLSVPVTGFEGEEGLRDLSNRPVVIHDSDGNRVACTMSTVPTSESCGWGVGVAAVVLLVFTALAFPYVIALRLKTASAGEDAPEYMKRLFVTAPWMSSLLPQYWRDQRLHALHHGLEILSRFLGLLLLAAGAGPMLFMFLLSVFRMVLLRVFAPSVCVSKKSAFGEKLPCPTGSENVVKVVEEWLLRLYVGFGALWQPLVYLSLFPRTWKYVAPGSKPPPAGEEFAMDVMHPVLIMCEYAIVLGASLARCSKLGGLGAVVLVFGIPHIALHIALCVRLRSTQSPRFQEFALIPELAPAAAPTQAAPQDGAAVTEGSPTPAMYALSGPAQGVDVQEQVRFDPIPQPARFTQDTQEGGAQSSELVAG
eukprot:TRINITY_DN8065_c4_g1_i1.p1 TRINITY_DN8065_c4_g1~~TRINITY_DN8065_c4_g1_i1.p1  ORF type:complete len:486 (+),score=63.55 TRINITY_DN8065_c4_g1_i1:96-1553(+)